jgi:hypothetical protein
VAVSVFKLERTALAAPHQKIEHRLGSVRIQAI